MFCNNIKLGELKAQKKELRYLNTLKQDRFPWSSIPSRNTFL